jgi:hypothetical protein
MQRAGATPHRRYAALHNGLEMTCGRQAGRHTDSILSFSAASAPAGMASQAKVLTTRVGLRLHLDNDSVAVPAPADKCGTRVT